MLAFAMNKSQVFKNSNTTEMSSFHVTFHNGCSYLANDSLPCHDSDVKIPSIWELCHPLRPLSHLYLTNTRGKEHGKGVMTSEKP